MKTYKPSTEVLAELRVRKIMLDFDNGAYIANALKPLLEPDVPSVDDTGLSTLISEAERLVHVQYENSLKFIRLIEDTYVDNPVK